MAKDPMFVDVFYPNVVDSVLPGRWIRESGYSRRDSLVAFNGKEMTSWNEFLDNMAELKAKAELDKEDFGCLYAGLLTCRSA